MTEHLPLKQTATARTLDGARVAGEIKQEVRDGVNEFVRLYDAPPALAVVRVGDDAASLVYVRNKIRTSEELGFRSEHHALPASTSEAELLAVIGELNRRDDVAECAGAVAVERLQRNDVGIGRDPPEVSVVARIPFLIIV